MVLATGFKHGRYSRRAGLRVLSPPFFLVLCFDTVWLRGRQKKPPSYPRRGLPPRARARSLSLDGAACGAAVLSSVRSAAVPWLVLSHWHTTPHHNTHTRAPQHRLGGKVCPEPRNGPSKERTLAWPFLLLTARRRHRPACFQDSSRLGEGPRPSDFLAACRDIRTASVCCLFWPARLPLDEGRMDALVHSKGVPPRCCIAGRRGERVMGCRACRGRLARSLAHSLCCTLALVSGSLGL